MTEMECAERGCCNQARSAVVLGGATETLALEGFQCSGDDSQVCCNAPAYGQMVVATGRLARNASNPAIRWTLQDARLCTSPLP